MNFPGGWELILVLLVIVVVFGSKRLPDSARALGRSMRILKAETKGLHDDDAAPTPQVTAGQPQPRPMQQPVVAQEVQVQPGVPATPPTSVTYSGQQLFDAQGRPVQLPVDGPQGPSSQGHVSQTQP